MKKVNLAASTPTPTRLFRSPLYIGGGGGGGGVEGVGGDSVQQKCVHVVLPLCNCR